MKKEDIFFGLFLLGIGTMIYFVIKWLKETKNTINATGLESEVK